MGHAQPLKVFENAFTQGTVQQIVGDTVLVAGKCGIVRALRAESCLLVPQPRDTVLLALLDDGSAWVLALLRRNASADTTAELRLPDTATLRARTLDIRADDAALTAESLHLHGKSLALEGDAVVITSRLLTLGGQVLLQGFAVMRTLARNLGEQIARRVGRYGSLDENVDGLARRTAGRAQVAVDTTYRLRAENADMRASGQMDLDASHIKVG